jgi:hypothetical protein
MRSGTSIGDGVHGLPARADHFDLVSPDRSKGATALLNDHLVVDEQILAARFISLHFTSAGTTIVNRAPPSAQFSTEILSVPPRPADRVRWRGPYLCPTGPPSRRRRDRNRSKTCGRSPSAIRDRGRAR